MPDLDIAPSQERTESPPAGPTTGGPSPLGISDPALARLVDDGFRALGPSGDRLTAFSEQAARDGWPAALGALRQDDRPAAQQLAGVLETARQAGWIPGTALQPGDPRAEAEGPGLSQDPRRGWNQRLLPDGRTEMVTGSGATVESFARQFNVSEAAAGRWFQQNGLGTYLPRESDGVRGFLGGKDYPEVPAGTRVVLDRPLRPDIHELTGQQVADHLMLAIEDTHRQGLRHLSIPRYFQGTGGTQSPMLKFGERGLWWTEPMHGATIALGGRRVPIARIEIAVDLAGMDRIELYSSINERFVGDQDQSSDRFNVEFRRDAGGSSSITMFMVQFTSYADAVSFSDYAARRPRDD